MSLYQILELEQSASIEDIKRNYRRLAKKYHPDKSKDPASVSKFEKINSAYEILSDDKSRQEYLMLNSEGKTQFQSFLEKIFSNNLRKEELDSYGINLTKNDYEYLQVNFYEVMNRLNLGEIINFFKSGEFPKKDYEFNSICSDSEINKWGNEEALYFDSLPLELQKHNSNTLRINLDISLEEVLNKTKKKITIKRQVDDKFKKTDFEFTYKCPWVVFSGGGDLTNENSGDLIIKLSLPENFDWQENLIIYQHYISLYEYVYGTNVCFKIGKQAINYNCWVPSREGNIIFIKNILEEYNQNFSIKFILNYNDNVDKKNLLREYFN